VSARRGPPARRCSGGIFDGVVLVVVVVAVFGAAAAASGKAAVDTSSERRPPPPEQGAAIDQSDSPSTGGTRRPPLLDRSLTAATAAESCALCVCAVRRCVRECGMDQVDGGDGGGWVVYVWSAEGAVKRRTALRSLAL